MTSSTGLESPRVSRSADWVRPDSRLVRISHWDGKPNVSRQEIIDLLIASLENADKAVADKVEAVLTRIGSPAVPALIHGLTSANSRVKSVCAMALVRIGQPVVDDLQRFYRRYAGQADIRAQLGWVIEFILGELGAQSPLPAPEKEFADRKVVPFSKALPV
jgi:hypothetical protein